MTMPNPTRSMKTVVKMTMRGERFIVCGLRSLPAPASASSAQRPIDRCLARARNEQRQRHPEERQWKFVAAVRSEEAARQMHSQNRRQHYARDEERAHTR